VRCVALRRCAAPNGTASDVDEPSVARFQLMTNDTKHMLEVRPLSLTNKTIVIGEPRTDKGRPVAQKY